MTTLRRTDSSLTGLLETVDDRLSSVLGMKKGQSAAVATRLANFPESSFEFYELLYVGGSDN